MTAAMRDAPALVAVRALTKHYDLRRGLRRLPGRFVAAWERESGRAAS